MIRWQKPRYLLSDALAWPCTGTVRAIPLLWGYAADIELSLLSPALQVVTICSHQSAGAREMDDQSSKTTSPELQEPDTSSIRTSSNRVLLPVNRDQQRIESMLHPLPSSDTAYGPPIFSKASHGMTSNPFMSRLICFILALLPGIYPRLPPSRLLP